MGKIINLPGATEMEGKMLKINSNHYWKKYFYPLLLQHERRSFANPHSVALLLTNIIYEYVERLPVPFKPVMAKIMCTMHGESFINALVKDAEFAKEVKKSFRELLLVTRQ